MPAASLGRQRGGRVGTCLLRLSRRPDCSYDEIVLVRLLAVATSLVMFAAASDASACGYVPGVQPVFAGVPANGWIWVFAGSAEVGDHARLEGPDGAIALEVMDALPRGNGRWLVALRPVSGPLTPGADYTILDDRAPEWPRPLRAEPAADVAPPSPGGFDGGYALWGGVDSCVGGPGGVVYTCLAHVATGHPLLEGLLVDDASGDVVDASIARGHVSFAAGGREDASGLSVEIRTLGPTGQRGQVWAAPLTSFAGYIEESAPPSPLSCSDGVLANADGPVADSPRFTPVSTTSEMSGGCVVGGAGACRPWWLAGLGLGAFAWMRRGRR